MSLSESLLPEFDYEMANTRKTLERVPEGRFDWKPHEKSMALGGLATHLANIPSWVVYALGQESLDIAPPGQPEWKIPQAQSRREVLEAFDQNVLAGRSAIAGASDADLLKSWTLLSGGKPILSMPRIAVLRNFVLNHNVHHRAQLGVYLRLNDVPVPSIYGPSADEGQM